MIRGVDVPGNVVATYDTKSPCKGGACVPNKGSLSGVCQYTAPKYDEKLNKTIGDITQCVRFKDTPGPFPAQENVQMSWVKCGDNGEVFLPFGAAEYVGLGFSVFTFLVITEMFGSPFVRNCQVAIALLAGFAVSAIATYNVPGANAIRLSCSSLRNKIDGSLGTGSVPHCTVEPDRKQSRRRGSPIEFISLFPAVGHARRLGTAVRRCRQWGCR
jgi:hypothetical protein